jgi:hypothetical protein
VSTVLVCPNCGSDRTGTIEKAYIWQPATFTRIAEGADPEIGSGHEDAHGNPVDVEWDAYDSEDVGDTETVGFCCKECIATWDGNSVVPFVAPAEVPA